MHPKKLHIITFDVPYPADYGGVIDVFYKIKSLHALGIEIYLHCFKYGREEAKELEQYCQQVWYYERKTGLNGISLSLPYMVYSRRDAALLPRLLSIDAPILFEGLHTCYLLDHPGLAHRLKIVRTHNVEQQYFKRLAQRATSIFSKCYYSVEAALLRRFEHRLVHASMLLPIAKGDEAFFRQAFPGKNIILIPGFHPFSDITMTEGKGAYCLYHANLSHPENIEAALFLIQKVFKGFSVPLVIAGRHPDPKIVAACADRPQIRLVANPDEQEMSELLAGAQIQVLPTFQASGLKLKLLYALFAGKFVLVNPAMVEGTDLAELCKVATDESADFKAKILLLMETEFDAIEMGKRRAFLLEKYNNSENASMIIHALQA